MINLLKKLFWGTEKSYCEEIPEENKTWVKNNTIWLKKVLGKDIENNNYNKLIKYYDLSKFPNIDIYTREVIQEIKRILKINNVKIDVIWTKDLRDVFETPMITESRVPFEYRIQRLNTKRNFKLYLSKALQKSPKRLLYIIAISLTEVLFQVRRIKHYKGRDKEELLLLASLYLGLEVFVIIGSETYDIIRDGEFTTDISYFSLVPISFLIFMLCYIEKYLKKDIYLLVEHKEFSRYLNCYNYWKQQLE
ncbi:hypothetical protein KRX57_01595 [Weeksellaceae bacterium TAE3-ERU29]|nr:hypothetical protein [Weeksellaceae bacterium TAE3-ERU29]